jgi:hypothetical protein
MAKRRPDTRRAEVLHPPDTPPQADAGIEGELLRFLCHKLLGNPSDVVIPYYVNAFSLAMTAVEASEAERMPLGGLSRFVVRPSQLTRKHGVSYQRIQCHMTEQNTFPVKDSYMQGLEAVTRTQIIICCVDEVESLCPEHRLDSSFVSGSYARFRAFSKKSPYFMRKRATLATLNAAFE